MYGLWLLLAELNSVVTTETTWLARPKNLLCALDRSILLFLLELSAQYQYSDSHLGLELRPGCLPSVPGRGKVDAFGVGWGCAPSSRPAPLWALPLSILGLGPCFLWVSHLCALVISGSQPQLPIQHP